MKQLVIKSMEIQDNKLVLGVENLPLARNVITAIKDKKCVCEIKQYREKRSLNANALLWVMCEDIAQALNAEQNGMETTDRVFYTKESVYKTAIEAVGIFRDIEITTDAVAFMRKVWSDKGLGWFSKLISEEKAFTQMRLYYGSSCYNVAQMRKLLDYVVQDALNMQLNVLPEEERQKLLEDWHEKHNG